MKKYTLILMLFLHHVPNMMQGQQLPLFSQYRTHQGIINPASITNDYWVNKVTFLYSASYRKQWSGFESSPRTMNVQGLYIKELGNASLFGGGFVLSDKLGRESSTGFYARFGSTLKISDDLYLSAGFSGGAIQYNVNLENVSVFNSAEALAITSQNQTYPDIGFGLNVLRKLSDEDNLFVGFSAPQLLGLDLSYNRNDPTEFHISKVRHFYGLAGYTKKFGNSSIEASTWIKYVKNAPIHPDLNVRFHYKQEGWAGIGFGGSGLFFDLGININKTLRIGYGTTAPITGNLGSLGLSHEVNLGNGISKKKKAIPSVIPNYPTNQTIHILAVGINDYEGNGFNDLSFPENGINDFCLLYAEKGLTGQVVRLMGAEATREHIISALTNFANNPSVKPTDLLLFYYMGHGKIAGNESKIGICPYDYGDADDIIEEKTIREMLNASKAKHKVCFIESCRNRPDSDDTEGMGFIDPENIKKFHNERLNIPGGMAFIASCEPGQESAGTKKEGGRMNKYIIQALKGKADFNDDRIVTIDEVITYMKPKVVEESKGKQNPVINYDFVKIKDLPLMILTD